MRRVAGAKAELSTTGTRAAVHRSHHVAVRPSALVHPETELMAAPPPARGHLVGMPLTRRHDGVANFQRTIGASALWAARQVVLRTLMAHTGTRNPSSAIRWPAQGAFASAITGQARRCQRTQSAVQIGAAVSFLRSTSACSTDLRVRASPQPALRFSRGR
jgi:hypothetical protein